MAKKKQEKKTITCADCIHEYACASWNIGNIHNMDARHCVNHETVKESTAYFIGFREGAKAEVRGRWIKKQYSPIRYCRRCGFGGRSCLNL